MSCSYHNKKIYFPIEIYLKMIYLTPMATTCYKNILKDYAWFFAFFKSLIQLGTLYSIRKGAKGKLQANIIRLREIMDYFVASGLYSGFQSKI